MITIVRYSQCICFALHHRSGPHLAIGRGHSIHHPRCVTARGHGQLGRVAKRGAIQRHRRDGAAAHRYPGRQAGVAADGGDGEIAAAPADRAGHILAAAIGQGRRGAKLLVLPHRDSGALRGHGQLCHDGIGHIQGRAAGLTAGDIGGRNIGATHAHPGRQPADDGGYPRGVAAPAGGAGDVLAAVIGQLCGGGQLYAEPDRYRGRIRRDLHPGHGSVAHRQRGAVAQKLAIDAARRADIGRTLRHPGRHPAAAIDGGDADVVAAPADMTVPGHLLTGAIRHPGAYRERLAQACRYRLDARAHLQAGHLGAGHRQGRLVADLHAIDDSGGIDVGGAHPHPAGQPFIHGGNERVAHPTGTLGHRQTGAVRHQRGGVVLLGQADGDRAPGRSHLQGGHGRVCHCQLRAAAEGLAVDAGAGVEGGGAGMGPRGQAGGTDGGHTWLAAVPAGIQHRLAAAIGQHGGRAVLLRQADRRPEPGRGQLQAGHCGAAHLQLRRAGEILTIEVTRGHDGHAANT
ncbi:hypothetical protein D3C79_393600 [compost metagenome]